MPALRALRQLRPLLACPTQARVASARAESSCANAGPEPPCPPCAPPPRPPCRTRAPAGLAGRRVVCCPPPSGARPPCDPPPPACALTCDNRVRQAARRREEPADEPQCGAESDRVARRMRAQEEARQRQYERDVAARKAAPPPPEPPGALALPGAERRALATDGRRYTVLGAPPPPACPAQPARHPPAQRVPLAPLGDCSPSSPHVDPCAHRPRVMLSIDRSGRPRPSSPNDCDGMIPPADPEPRKLRPESQEPQPLPKKSQETMKPSTSPKGLTSRIIESLSRGRGATSPGRGGGRGAGLRRAGDSGWCASPPPPAPAPQRCREASVAERLRRGPRGPCGGGGGARRLHTAARLACARRPPAPGPGREAALAAAAQLEAALQERSQLREAGRGRELRGGRCASPPAPARGAGGALELRVPPGADTVCVRVSLGSAPRAPPPPPPPAPAGGARPPGAACSDSWLSIKKLQKKLSSCGRGEAAPGACAAPLRRAPGVAPPGPAPAPPKRKPASPCSTGSRVKMADLVPHTIFIKS